MSVANELWYVQLSDGDVHRVTLDQLAEGFEAGHIDERTMVLRAGATQWTKLGELAGMDEIAPPPPPAAVVPLLAPPPLSAIYAAPPPLIESHRPVSLDLSELDDVPGLPRRSGKRWIATLLGVAMLGGIAGVGVERPSLLQSSLVSARTGAVAAKSWVATEVPGRLFGKKSPEPASTASPPSAEATPTSPSTSPPPSVQNTAPTAEPAAPPAAALASDRGSSEAAKPPARGAGSKWHFKKAHPKPQGSPDVPQRPPSAGGFTTGGSKFDPLSSTIQ